jgi:hypothetical protein
VAEQTRTGAWICWGSLIGHFLGKRLPRSVSQAWCQAARAAMRNGICHLRDEADSGDQIDGNQKHSPRPSGRPPWDPRYNSTIAKTQGARALRSFANKKSDAQGHSDEKDGGAFTGVTSSRACHHFLVTQSDFDEKSSRSRASRRIFRSSTSPSISVSASGGPGSADDGARAFFWGMGFVRLAGLRDRRHCGSA